MHPLLHAVLFVLHDAGEFLALAPVVKRLLHGPLDAQRLAVLPLGEPATSMALCLGAYAAPDCEVLPALQLSDVGVQLKVKDATAGRQQLLHADHLQLLLEALSPPHGVSVVVAGMNYAMQLQVGAALRRRGARFAAYYDGVGVVGTDKDVPGDIQLLFAETADELWVPSLLLRPGTPPWQRGRAAWRAVGQPTLETWTAMAEDAASLRGARGRIYGEAAASGAPALCWFGGYGAGYEDSLRLWCGAVRMLRAAAPRLLFSLAVHPGPFGDVDRRVLREEGLEDVVRVVPRDIPGAAAALASNLTVSQGSTGGVQSLFAGKPALYVDTTGHSFGGMSLGLLLGLIDQVNTSRDAVLAVHRVQAQGWAFDASRLATAGVPRNSTALTAERVLALLSSSLAAVVQSDSS